MKIQSIFLCWMLAAATVFGAHKSGNAALDQTVEKANTDWLTAMKTGDAKTIAEPYAEEGVFVGIDGKCTQGRAEIQNLYEARFQKGLATSTKIDSRSLILDGDLAYESGYGEVGMNKDGKTVTNGGRYFTVWQLQAGKWKIIRNLVLP